MTWIMFYSTVVSSRTALRAPCQEDSGALALMPVGPLCLTEFFGNTHRVHVRRWAGEFKRLLV